jgi:hypothetical protein
VELGEEFLSLPAMGQLTHVGKRAVFRLGGRNGGI